MAGSQPLARESRDFSLPDGSYPPAINEIKTLLKTLSEQRIAAAHAQCPQKPADGSPFVDAMLAAPRITSTENGAATYDSSGSARVDFFFQVMEGTPAGDVRWLLQRAWRESPQDALQLMAQLRDVRHGKGEIAKFHECVAWLIKRHPNTLVFNARHIPQVGYWKDLLMIVERACIGDQALEDRAHDESRRQKAKETRWEHRREKKRSKAQRIAQWRDHLNSLPECLREAAKKERAAFYENVDKQRVEKAAEARHRRRLAGIEHARMKLASDEGYRLLHLTVASMFARELQFEIERVKAGKHSSSLVAKWAPSPGNAFDRRTLLGTTIAGMLYPEASCREESEPAYDFARRIRIQLQVEYLTPLRRAAQLPEVYMSANQWDQIPYERVASVCMKTNKSLFEAHDGARFAKYLGEVKAGTKKINASVLKPHHLVREAMGNAAAPWMEAEQATSALSQETMELQWAAYVQRLREGGALSSAMAVCDVSGSMMGQPMEVAIALSLLVAELAAPPFNQIMCTFSASPRLHRVTGTSLVDKVKGIQNMDWGTNTDFNAVFELVLAKAIAAKLKPDEMIQTLFVFSDMEFDEAAGAACRRWAAEESTNLAVAKRTFEEAGYTLPRIVFWNLAGRDRGDGTTSTPVTTKEDGTALVSGFSGQLLKLFMEGGVEGLQSFTPESVMQAAIKRYAGWTVVD